MNLPYMPRPELYLPWTTSDEDNERFLKLAVGFLIFTLVMACIWPFLPRYEMPREEQEEIPPQLARVIEEIKEVAPKPKPKPEPKPVKEEKKPKEKKEEKKEEPKPVEEAKVKAEESGVMNFTDDLADMRDSLDLGSLTEEELSSGPGDAAETKRDIIGREVSKTSGGVNTSAMSQDVGGGGSTKGRQTTRFSANKTGLPSTSQKASRKTGVLGERSSESIRKVFAKHQRAIDIIYKNALKQDPLLQGRVVVKLVIDANGKVSQCTILSSELDDAKFKSKIIARIKRINFGAEKVKKTTVNYSFDFFPV